MHALIDYLAKLPVEWFVMIGAFVQELISPLPSFVVFVPAGASLAAHGQSWGYLVLIAFVAAIGRVAAALLLYWLSESLRAHLYTKRRRWMGISRHDIKRLEKHFTARGSWWAIFTLWAVPVVPGLVISLAGGFMRVPLAIFISATYVGAVINALMYLIIGYVGLEVIAPLGDAELVLIGALCVLIIAAVIIKRRK